ncbi:hypothetical protein AGMMS50212_00160 [Spirochaetia bacterium]|nr:hypothetical protein AGMMS50212_00160 [Spirochaetia bacterium]
MGLHDQTDKRPFLSRTASDKYAHVFRKMCSRVIVDCAGNVLCVRLPLAVHQHYCFYGGGFKGIIRKAVLRISRKQYEII